MNEDEGVEEGGIYRKVWLGESATILRVGLGKIDNAKCPLPSAVRSRHPIGRASIPRHLLQSVRLFCNRTFLSPVSCRRMQEREKARKLKNRVGNVTGEVPGCICPFACSFSCEAPSVSLEEAICQEIILSRVQSRMPQTVTLKLDVEANTYGEDYRVKIDG
jgi:hypothetical protein